MREARGTRPCYLAALISDAWIVTQCAKRVARIHASALSDDDECKDRDTMRVARGTRPCFLIEQSDVCKERDAAKRRHVSLLPYRKNHDAGSVTRCLFAARRISLLPYRAKCNVQGA